jgi:hypothetical protein
MASNPFDERPDYGTVTGQSTGFRTDEFSRVQQKVASDAQEIKRLSECLRLCHCSGDLDIILSWDPAKVGPTGRDVQ